MRGFTLVELMIVVAIIGILAAVAVPAYQDFTVRAKVVEGVVMVGQAKTAIEDYYHANNALPANNAQAGLDAAASYSTAFVQAVTIGAAGIIDVSYLAATGGTILDGDRIRYTPAITANNLILWSCNVNSTLAAKYRPANCR